MNSFEQLEVWQRGVTLCVELYKMLGKCNEYWLKNEILKAALSISSNIAEGYERSSTRDYVRFLYIAKASCAEVRSQIYIGSQIGVLTNAQIAHLTLETKRITKMLQAMISKLKNRIHSQ